MSDYGEDEAIAQQGFDCGFCDELLESAGTKHTIVDCAYRLQADNERMRTAVRALYYAAHWTPDREVDAGKLWEDVRDAAGFPPGNAPEREPTS